MAISELEQKRDVQDALRESHGTRVCRLRDCMQMLLILVIIGVAVWAINTQDEKLIDVSEFIEGLGFWGIMIFFFIFVFVSMPFGYNWSTSVVLVGFAYGWIGGLILSNVGTVVGAVLAYYTSRFCMRSCVQRYVTKLGPKKRLYLQAVTKVVESGHGPGFLMQLLLRLQPVQTFGLTNAFFGVITTIPMWMYCLTTLIGSEHSIIMLTSIGVLVKDVGSLEKAADSEAGRVNILVTAGICIVSLIGVFVFARYLAIHVLPGMIDNNVHNASIVNSTPASLSINPCPDAVLLATKDNQTSFPLEVKANHQYESFELPGVVSTDGKAEG